MKPAGACYGAGEGAAAVADDQVVGAEGDGAGAGAGQGAMVSLPDAPEISNLPLSMRLEELAMELAPARASVPAVMLVLPA